MQLVDELQIQAVLLQGLLLTSIHYVNSLAFFLFKRILESRLGTYKPIIKDGGVKTVSLPLHIRINVRARGFIPM